MIHSSAAYASSAATGSSTASAVLISGFSAPVITRSASRPVPDPQPAARTAAETALRANAYLAMAPHTLDAQQTCPQEQAEPSRGPIRQRHTITIVGVYEPVPTMWPPWAR